MFRKLIKGLVGLSILGISGIANAIIIDFDTTPPLPTEPSLFSTLEPAQDLTVGRITANAIIDPVTVAAEWDFAIDTFAIGELIEGEPIEGEPIETVLSVPEPATFFLLCAGLGIFGFMNRRRHVA